MVLDLLTLAVFTDEEIIAMSRLKLLIKLGVYSEITPEYKRLTYVKHLYNMGRITDWPYAVHGNLVAA